MSILRLTEEQYAEARKRGAKKSTAIKTPKSKYGNIPTDGKDSKREAKRGDDLRFLQQHGAISDLEEQVKYVLIPRQNDANGKCLFRAVTYTADYRYVANGKVVVEDVKGYPNDRWPMKKALMYFRFGILVQEV